MNFALGGSYSVILMSRRANAPYADRLEDDGSTLIYEGHDVPRRAGLLDPKQVDQPDSTSSGRLTENGKFYQAVQKYKGGDAPPTLVRVYEKIYQGIWSYNGVFELIDAWREDDGRRLVYKFKLVATAEDIRPERSVHAGTRRRLIPTQVKLDVWKRDKGRCVICGATDELHFDHDVPFSVGGSSITASNVQLLCARHNLSKGAKIQ